MTKEEKRNIKWSSSRERHDYHVILRVKERYGLDFERKDISRIIGLIQTGKSTDVSLEFLSKDHVHRVDYNGVRMYFVVPRNKQFIRTSITKDMTKRFIPRQ